MNRVYMPEYKYADKINLFKEALEDIQKKNRYLFKQKPGSLSPTFPGILTQCFFAVKDGKPIFRFFHDCKLPEGIRQECDSVFLQLFNDDID